MIVLCYNQISIFIVHITQLLWSVTKTINIKNEKLFSSLSLRQKKPGKSKELKHQMPNRIWLHINVKIVEKMYYTQQGCKILKNPKLLRGPREYQWKIDRQQDFWKELWATK